MTLRSALAREPLSGALRRHGPLLLFLIGFFGWVDTLPLYGSAAAVWAAGHHVAFAPLPLWFLATHAPALVVWGIVWDRHPQWAHRGATAAVGLGAALTVLVFALPAAAWPWLFAAMGVTAGVALPAWGRWYVATVPTRWLGRIFAVAAAGVDAVKWLSDDATRVVPHGLAILSTLIPLALGGLALLWLSGLEGAPNPSATPSRPVAGAFPRIGPGGVAGYALFIVLFSVVAGFSYRFFAVAPLTPYVDESLRRLPYLAAVLAAGVIADRRGLQWAVVLGTGLLAVAFLIGAWGQPLAQYMGLVLNGGAFGLLEQAPWLLTAVVATPATAGRGFGLGLNLNVVPIFIGGWVTGFFREMSPAHLGLLAAVVLMVAILSLQGVEDPLAKAQARDRTPPSAVASSSADVPRVAAAATALPLEALLAHRYGGELTSRELEIGQLAMMGVSTRDIANRLIISENTVKTHLRNVYRKTGSANRADLLRKLLGAVAEP